MTTTTPTTQTTPTFFPPNNLLLPPTALTPPTLINPLTSIPRTYPPPSSPPLPLTDHCLSQTHAVFYTASKGTLSILSFQRGTYTPLTLPPFKDLCLTSSNVVILTSSSRLEVRALSSPSSPSRQVKVHPSLTRVLPLGLSGERAMCLDAHGTGRPYDLVTGRKGDASAGVIDVTPDGDVVTEDEKGVRIGDKSWGCDAGRLEETG
eukprot:CAMPEP_0182458328 /NCGR_PEP_ID=MMETSP1319-20130603/3694_1 /TAXON_ID=172717 /ORGANISM="Bolidomonas pacifica, Strain RCC208" /LENGTH=205 /DNA_ID=CAMNT_0024656993 /DNA_START=154 /DNA_END=767 /DNA_ORIENTATION=-